MVTLVIQISTNNSIPGGQDFVKRVFGSSLP